MKIVVHGTNWIGDAVMSIPALRMLREAFPEAELTLYTLPWAKGIFRDSGFVDRILSPPESKSKISSLKSEIRLWREEKFDIAILFTNSFRTGLISRLGAAKKRFGYANEGRGILLSQAIPIPEWKDTRHESYYYLELVAEVCKLLGVDHTKKKVEYSHKISVSKDRKKAARKILVDSGIDDSKPLIGIGAGSQNSNAKRWAAQSYAQLGDEMIESLGADVVLLGSMAEVESTRKVAEAMKNDPVDLAGKTSLDEAVAVIAELDAFVSNDMGLAHVASAVGTKSITIFGPTNPLTTKPWGNEIAVRDDVECAPCMLRECPIDHRCMTRITPDDIFEKVKALINT